jgi:hypothetical protein
MDSGVKTAMDPIKPPVPVEVVDLNNFARLALALTDGSQLLWNLVKDGKRVLALFTAYMYWNGDIPLLAYVIHGDRLKPFLAYRSDALKGEEWLFTEDADDPKYKYGSFIDVKDTPPAFEECLKGEYPSVPKPMLAEVESVNSIMRILIPLSIREGTIFPLWHFVREKKHVVGTCIPFEHYYDADALPVFFYVTLEEPPKAPFIKYLTSKPKGEDTSLVSNTADAKYFYAKIIDVKDMPIFP